MKSRLLAARVWCLLLLVSLGASLNSLGVEAPPEVKAFAINGGAPQRSMVTSIAITFSADVGASLQVDDLRLTNLTNNTAVTGAQFIYQAATKTGTWTFPTQFGKSLPDGNYLAVIRPADVVGPTGLQLVPNPGATTWSTKFHRYFGDFDGDRDVDFLDTAVMRKADLTAPPNKNYNPAADFNGDGRIDDTDLAAFKARYLTVLSGQTFAPTVVGAPVRTSQQTVTLSGTAPPNTHVVITNGFFTFEGQSDENGKFSITVSLLSNRINSLFVGGDGFTTTDFSALTPVTIVQDSTPPFLYVDSPADQSTVDTATATVTGRVGDLLSGFEGLTVKVNQVDANISAGIGPNGTFEARDIPLAMGENFLAIIATDSLGTSITKSVMVTRVAQLQMEVVSGNDQTAVRNTELPAALVVRVRDTKGQLFANKIVNFQVTRSDGHTSPTQGQTDIAGPMMAQARTDAQGIASAFWRLGSDSGHSNNLLVATSAGVPGEARFRASADPSPPTQINVGMGNNQIGEAGGSAPLPLTAWASDNLNGAPNVPVTFKVTSGDAQVAAKDQATAQGSVTIPTDSTGHVDAYLHFGTSGGPVTVEAGFVGLQGNPAVFMARALVRKPGQPATFNAVVQDNTGLAIGGATCTLNINGIKLPPVISDANGFFTIADVNPGAGFVQVDGRTANKLGGQPFNQPGRFPSLVYRITIVPNADNPLPTTVYLPTLNPVNERTYDGTADVDLTIQGIAGLKMTIKAGSMTLADGTRPTAATPVTVSLNQVHADNIPMPIQDGVAPLLTWTLQPPGAHFDPPVTIQYPNMTGLRAGATTNFLSYNHDVERFEIVASGTVSTDGSVIKTDPGVGLLNSGWGCNCPPYTSTGKVQCPFDLKIDSADTSSSQVRNAVVKGGSGPFTYSWTIGGSEVSVSASYNLPQPPKGAKTFGLDANLTVTDTKTGDVKMANTTLLAAIIMITPDGDPVARPVDSGDGTNEFTFSTAKVGVLIISLKAKFPGLSKFGQSIQDKLHFDVSAVGGAKKNWGSFTGGKPKITGDILEAELKFEGLPDNNSDFGLKTAEVFYDGKSVADAKCEVFYPAYAKNHPTGDAKHPNWFHYYKQNAGGGAYGYDSTPGARSMSTSGGGEKSISIGDYVHSPGGEYITTTTVGGQLKAVGWSGTYKYYAEFLGVLAHEGQHATKESKTGDSDGDDLPDLFETGTSLTDPKNKYSARGSNPLFTDPGFSDDEIYAGGPVEETATLNADTSQDWANPGTNHK